MKKEDIITFWTIVAQEEYPGDDKSREKALFKMNEIISQPIFSRSTEALSLVGEFRLRKIIQETWSRLLVVLWETTDDREARSASISRIRDSFASKIGDIIDNYSPTNLSENPALFEECGVTADRNYDFSSPLVSNQTLDPNTYHWVHSETNHS